MTTSFHMCPECGCPDVELSGQGLVDAEGISVSTAKCPVCGWEGKAKDTVGVATTEKLWTTERIAEHLLHTMAEKVMPILLEDMFHLGLLPRARKLPDNPTPEQVVEVQLHNRQVAQSSVTILHKMMPDLLTAMFVAAAEEAENFRDDPQVGPTLAGLEAELRSDAEFGGDYGQEEG